MIDPADYFTREEERLSDELDAGKITDAEYREEIRELQRDHRGAAEEAAQEAYEREMDRW